MNPFGKRTDEELGRILYGRDRGKLEQKPPPDRESELEVEEDAEVEDEKQAEEEKAPPVPRPVRQTGLSDLLTDDVMSAIEADIERLDNETDRERQRIEKNLNQKT